MLGVLPGSIGIGAGVMMDYSTPSSASISTAASKRADKGPSINYVVSRGEGSKIANFT